MSSASKSAVEVHHRIHSLRILSLSVIRFEFVRIIFGLLSFHMMQPDDIKVDVYTHKHPNL